MATFVKRANGWRAEIRKRSLNIYRSATFPTKARAREWAAETEAALAAGALESESTLIVRDLFDRYAKHVAPKHKGARWDQIRLSLLGKMKLADVPVAKVSRRDIAEWRDQRLQQVAPASVRREMNLLSSVFSVAVYDWEALKENPLKGVRRPSPSSARDRRVSDTESSLMCATLGLIDDQPVKKKKQQTALAFLLGIETGMRAGEMAGLTWQRVNFEGRYCELPATKNGDKRQVPLSREAVRLLSRRLGETRPFDVSAASISVLFRRARIEAGVEDLHFHDSRHEAVTRLAKKLSILDLARAIGHRDLRSLQIYYNSTPQEIAAQLD